MNKKGMTLIELIVALALFSIVIVFLVTAIGPIIKISANHNKEVTAKSMAEITMATLKNEIRCAQHFIEVDNNDKTYTYYVNGDGLLTVNGTVIEGLKDPKFQNFKLKIGFTPESRSIKIKITVIADGKVVYSIESSVSAADETVNYLGQSSNMITFEKRQYCR